MKPVIVRNLRIGEGQPKICAPIVGKDIGTIISEAKNLLSLPVDIVEWRADMYDDALSAGKASETVKQIRETLDDLPLIFTFRTPNDGGKKPISPDDYVALIENILKTGAADIVDIELSSGEGTVRNLVNKAHCSGVKAIISNHDFFKTPDKNEIVKRLEKMRLLGADIPKIAVMPESRNDVLTLLSATLEMSEKHQDCPVITMSMSKPGVISRVSGWLFGSSVTFGAAIEASAPGQISVTNLSRLITQEYAIYN